VVQGTFSLPRLMMLGWRRELMTMTMIMIMTMTMIMTRMLGILRGSVPAGHLLKLCLG